MNDQASNSDIPAQNQADQTEIEIFEACLSARIPIRSSDEREPSEHIVVSKFGGTSLRDAASIARVAQIIKSDQRRRCIVVSAPGKRHKHDPKVTDMLYNLFDLNPRVSREEGDRPLFEKLKSDIEQRFKQICEELKIKDFNISEDSAFANIDSYIKKPDVISLGEYWMAQIMAELLGYTFVNATKVFRSTENIHLDSVMVHQIDTGEKAKSRLRNAIKSADGGGVVIPGFYAAVSVDKQDRIKTFSRGGSDVSAALAAELCDASLYENWTDVDGIYVIDPGLSPVIGEQKDGQSESGKVPVKVIERMTFMEVRELAYNGMQALHAETIAPVANASIPIHIRNTFNPQGLGTVIIPHEPEWIEMNPLSHTPHGIIGIASRNGFSVLEINEPQMNEKVGFACDIFFALKGRNIKVEHAPTGIDTMCIVLDTVDRRAHADFLNPAIASVVSRGFCQFRDHLALIAIVWREDSFEFNEILIGKRPTFVPVSPSQGVSAKSRALAYAMSTLTAAGINIEMITAGTTGCSIIVGVSSKVRKLAVEALYKGLYTE